MAVDFSKNDCWFFEKVEICYLSHELKGSVILDVMLKIASLTGQHARSGGETAFEGPFLKNSLYESFESKKRD